MGRPVRVTTPQVTVLLEVRQRLVLAQPLVFLVGSIQRSHDLVLADIVRVIVSLFGKRSWFQFEVAANLPATYRGVHHVDNEIIDAISRILR